MDTKKILDESNHFLMNTYGRLPVVFVKGRGMKVWASDGKEYLDFVGGIAVNILGHCHPRVVVAIQKQAQRLLHVSNLYHNEQQVKLARLLVGNSFAEKVFFCNSGAEANEAAIKLTRKYAKENMQGNRFEIITAFNSFHGRTLAALTATGQEKFRKGFEPLVPGFSYVEFDNLDVLARSITDKTCAVMLEPLQGEGGVRIPSSGYLKGVRDLCNDHKILLILDEVQTGMGRTGRLFAHEHYGIAPDIMTLSKGLGGGVPIGAMLATDKIASAFQPGSHASTFGGNPLTSAAAAATLETLIEDGYILDQCRRMGEYLMSGLGELKRVHGHLIAEVRGLGLMVGMELATECTSVVMACMNRGIIVNCTAGNVLRFTPPLIVRERDIDRMLDTLDFVFGRLS
jgi:acetylornithine/N-succinyldiaminopimelate aminotransferase